MTQAVNVPGVGTLQFPDGMSQADMAAAIQKNFPQIHQQQGMTAAQLGLDPKIYGPNFRGAPSTQSVGPPLPTFPNQLTADLSLPGAAPQGPQDITRGAMQEVAQNVAAGDQQIPFLQSEAFHEKATPYVLGGLASAIVPGSGWGALALQSLMGGAGTASGELIRQQQAREPADIATAARMGGEAAAGTAIAGGTLKVLGGMSKRFFSSPLDEGQQQAVQFARNERERQFFEGMSKGEARIPFPLSSAASDSAAGKAQQASRAFIAGDIKTQLDANKVTQYLNNTVGRMTEKGQIFDDAARQGQEFLRTVFEPGETAIKNTFSGYTEAVGANAMVPTTNTLAAVKKAAEMLENRGQTTGGLYQRLRTILKKSPGTYTPREFDELYGSIIKQAFTSKASAGGEGRMLLEGITQDLDEFGKLSGANVSFADEIANAATLREQFRELRKIPQLERLASEMGDRSGTRGTIDWMNSLFSSGNGKALAKMRELNPSLYHDLADAWLARQIDNASGYSKAGIGRTVDGAALRTWFEQNQGKIKEIYGAPQAKALDNFTIYAKYMTGAVERSKGGKTFDPLNLFARASAEAGSAYYKPAIVLAGEPASFILARGLADPNSALFKAFTEGFSPRTRAFAIKSGELAGHQAARAQKSE